MRTVIIDDEAKARRNISNLVNLLNLELEIAGEADDVKSGIDLINNNDPDLVFLDIQMPGGTGFDILDKVKNRNFQVIFTTAFDDYAIKAFRYSAIDYLLKPINPNDFETAVKKCIKNIEDNSYHMKINALLENISSANNNKLVLKTAEGYHLINIKEIMRCESDKGYTLFYLSDGQRILVSTILKKYDELLSDKGFLRTHQSHLVNINFIARFIKSDGGYIQMQNGDTVPVSKRKREVIIEMLDRWS